MAPSRTQQLLVWTLPTVAVLLSYLWYRRKRIGAPSDPGDAQKEHSVTEQSQKKAEAPVTPKSSPAKTFTRSLSGVESQPIDIVIPPKLKSSRSTPVVISDKDLDLEIEKVKSMKNGLNAKPFEAKSKTPSPPKREAFVHQTPASSGKTKVIRSAEGSQNESPMAQKDMAVVEEKLSSLKLSKCKESPKKTAQEKNETNGNKEREELQRQSSERDSANHSPADVMLASPSLSSISDNHSEGSSDSGKGGSDVTTPPPSRIPGTEESMPEDTNIPTIYEFIIPQSLVGKLIGRHGSSVTQIKEKTNAHIIVKRHPTNSKMKVCAIEGLQSEIDGALKMIRDKFPVKRYPEVTLEQVSFVPQAGTVPLIPDHLYLKLIEGINNDTILSCLVAPNHLFLQQPTHPSYPSLNVLNDYMNACYSGAASPMLPSPVPENSVCAAFSVDSWYRAMILTTDPETDTSYVKFLDCGGFAYVENSNLRQIRGDFMLLPFQAAECYLANIKVRGDDETWPEAAYDLIAELTKGAIIYTQVADFTEEGIPLVFCYVILNHQQVIFLNQELVNHGYAEWISFEEVPHIPQQQDDSSLEQQTDYTLQQPECIEGAVGGITA